MERRRTTSRKFHDTITKVTSKVATEAAAVVVRREAAERCTSRARRETWTWFGCCWTTEQWSTPLITSSNDLFTSPSAAGRRCAPPSGRSLNYSVKTVPTSTLSTRRCCLYHVSCLSIIYADNLLTTEAKRLPLGPQGHMIRCSAR